MKQPIFYWAFMMLAFAGMVNAQKYDANWVFGTNAGVYFDDTSALVFKKTCNTYELASSISDEDGNLLFYINPGRRYSNLLDKNENIIVNGDSILAYKSAVGGALIIPVSGNRFYLIHLGFDSISLNCGNTFCTKVYYSVVNRINGNLEVEKKNELLIDAYVDEKISVVQHANGKGWWLFAHAQMDSNSFCFNRFYKYYIEDTILISFGSQDIGICRRFSVSQLNQDMIGQMKFSWNGNHLGLVRYTSDYYELYDFDRCTGELGNYISNKINNAASLYGCEFALNSELFYISSTKQYNFSTNQWIPSEIYQLDFSNRQNPVLNRLVQTDSAFGQMQMTPLNTIFIANKNHNYDPEDTFNRNNQYVSVISDPDSFGLFCNIDTFSFFLGDSSKSTFSLPNFPNYRLGALSIYEADAGNDTIICTDDTLQQTKAVPLGTPAVSGVSYQWFPNYNLSSDTTAEVLAYPDNSTMYYLMLTDSTITNACKSRLDSVYVEVKACNVGIVEQLTDNNIKIYPNPATQTIMIQTENAQSSIKGVMMFDVTGKIVHSQQSADDSKMISFNISAVVNGLYFLHIEMSNGQRVVRKVVKE